MSGKNEKDRVIAFHLFSFMVKDSDESKPQDGGDAVTESGAINPEEAVSETRQSQSQAEEEVSSAPCLLASLHHWLIRNKDKASKNRRKIARERETNREIWRKERKAVQILFSYREGRRVHCSRNDDVDTYDMMSLPVASKQRFVTNSGPMGRARITDRLKEK